MRRLLPLWVCVACTGPTAVPELPDPGDEGYGVLVVGWDSDSARLLVPRESSPVNIKEMASLHWLALSDRSVATALPVASEVTLTMDSDLGAELPIRSAYQLLRNSDGVWDWAEESWDEELQQKHLYPTLAVDYEACRDLGGCYVAGACRERCDPEVLNATNVVAPDLPALECPAQWVDLGTDGDQFCWPSRWVNGDEAEPVAVVIDCGPGRLDAGRGCVQTSACLSGRFPSVAPGARPRIYIDPDAARGGDGSMNAPFRELPDPVAQSAVYVLSKGMHPMGTRVVQAGQNIDIIGACAASVEVAGRFVVSGGQLKLRSLSLSSDEVGVVMRNGNVGLQEVFIEGEDHAFVQTGGTSSSTLTRFETDFPEPHFDDFAVRVEGGRFQAEQSQVVGHFRQLNGESRIHNTAVVEIPAQGLLPDRANGSFDILGGSAELQGLRIHTELRFGLFVRVGDVDARDLFVTSRGRSCVASEGQQINLNIERLAAVGLPRDPLLTPTGVEIRPGSMRAHGANVRVRDLAGMGFPFGVVVDGSELPEDSEQFSLQRAWLKWYGEPGIWARQRTLRLVVEDVWLLGQPQTVEISGPLIATDNGVFKIESGAVDISRVRLRPITRHAFVLDDLATTTVEDAVVMGEHARTFFLESATKATFNRVRAVDGSGGAFMFDTGEEYDRETRTVHVSDLSIQLMQRFQYPLAGNGIPISFERFDMRGAISVDPDMFLRDVHFIEGRLGGPAGGTPWPPGFVGQFEHVFVSERASP